MHSVMMHLRAHEFARPVYKYTRAKLVHMKHRLACSFSPLLLLPLLTFFVLFIYPPENHALSELINSFEDNHG